MKKLLVERAITVAAAGSSLCESIGGRGYIVEAERSERGLLQVKLPVTILDQMNENHRNYRRTTMEQAMLRAKPAFEERSLLSSVNEHPQDPYVTPGQASHVVTAAWCENDGHLWNKWEVLNTATGRDLQALIEAGVAIGVSIRGLGSEDNVGNILEDYEYLGTDCVGQPSARIRTAPQRVAESASNGNNTVVVAPRAPTNPMPGTSPVKTKDAALRHIREQITLMQTESSMDAMRRLLDVEAVLAESTIPARELVECYKLLDEHKAKMAGATGTGGLTVEQLQAQLAEANRLMRARVVQVTERSKKQLAILRRVVDETSRRAANVDAQNATLRTRLEAAIQRSNAGSRRRIAERRVYRAAVARTRTLRETNAQLHTMYGAARDLAVASTARASIAIREGARLVAEARRAAAPAAPAAAPAAKPAVTESQPRRVVSTDTARAAALETGGKRRTVTNANRNGTTRIPGFI